MAVSIIVLLCAVSAFCLAYFIAAPAARTFVYVSNSVSGDISVFAMDGATGRLEERGAVKAGDVVMPLAVSPDKRFLYASIRSQPYSVASYAIDSQTGELDLLSIVPAAETLAYIATDASGRFLFGASYGGMLVSVNPIGKDGFLQAETACLLRPGRNPHCMVVDPSNRFVFATNLGSDQVCQYLFNEKTGVLTPNRPAIAPARHGSGPRHIAFSPNCRFVYVLTELSGEVICYALDPDAGTLTEKQYISIMSKDSIVPPGAYTPPNNAPAPGAKPAISSADLRITPDGRFLYASERTTSTLAGFSVDTAAGTLTYLGSAATETQPRGFNICPRGRYLIAAGEKSDHITVHAIDQDNGGLKAIGRYPAGRNPNWVEIVTFQ